MVTKKVQAPKDIKIFLDDVRLPRDIYLDGGTWITCRDIESCKRWLKMGNVTHISLDGDMGKVGDKDIPGGVELLDWMRQTNRWPKKEVLVHSQNPVKAQQMRTMISNNFISQDMDLNQ